QREVVVEAPQRRARLALGHLVAVEVEQLERVGPWLDPPDGRELPGLARVAPEAAPAAALARAVPQQHAVADLVLGAPDREVQQVLGLAHRRAGPPAHREALDLERRRVLTHEAGRRGGRRRAPRPGGPG